MNKKSQIDLFTPLSDEELDLLDEILLERFEDDEDTLDKDEGILCISGLDGFLTAVVSGPETIQPSRWLPAVWGDYAPVWKDEAVHVSHVLADQAHEWHCQRAAGAAGGFRADVQ